jgi:O-methyltransferase involved in polyketide biosynthesis/GNAT superfamily N-acetyltransferase
MMNTEGVAKTAGEAIHCKDPASKAAPLLVRMYQHRSKVMHVIAEKALTALKHHDNNAACGDAGATAGFEGACSGTDTSMGEEETSKENEKCTTQLLIIGAGFDTSYETLYSSPSSSNNWPLADTVFAVDLPSVIEKRKSNSSSSIGTRDVAADLCDIDSVSAGLASKGFDFGCRTVVVAEMVLNYLPTSVAVQRLLSYLAASFTACETEAILVCYDFVQITEESHFSRLVLEKFRERGAPLGHVPRNQVTHKGFLQGAGWATAGVRDIQSVWAHFDRSGLTAASRYMCTRRQQQQQQEGEIEEERCKKKPMPFDEYAALALLEQRYSISVASNVSMDRNRRGLGCGAGLLGDLGMITAAELRAAQLGLGLGLAPSGQAKEEEEAFPIACEGIRIHRLHTRSGSRVWREANTLYAACMQPYADTYPAVAKFVVKKAAKQLLCDSPHNHFSSGAGGGSLTFWVARDVGAEGGGHGVVGMVGLQLRQGGDSLSSSSLPVAELCHMAVHEAYRGKGLGMSLLAAALSYARNESSSSSSSKDNSSNGDARVSRVDLTVLTDLKAAQRLYVRAGFVALGPPLELKEGAHNSKSTSARAVCTLQRMTLQHQG